MLDLILKNAKVYLEDRFVEGVSVGVQAGRIASAGIAPYFKDIFISERLGANKPSPAFFQACFAAIPNFDPAAALVVGDSLTSDIRGARNVGLRSCWYNPEDLPSRPDIVPDYTIHALEELPPLLGLRLIRLHVGQLLLQLVLPGLAGRLLRLEGVDLALGHRPGAAQDHGHHGQQEQQGQHRRQPAEEHPAPLHLLLFGFLIGILLLCHVAAPFSVSPFTSCRPGSGGGRCNRPPDPSAGR